MRKYITTPLTLFTLSLASFHSVSYAQAQEVGRNAAIKGEVSIKSLDDVSKPAKIKAPVFLDDEVTSGEASALQIMLRDETKFTIGADCVMVIDRFVYDPDNNNNSVGATVKKGMFRFVSGKRGPASDTPKIETPTASLGIRGTMLEGLVGPRALELAANDGAQFDLANADREGATLVVLRGPGPAKRARDRRGAIDVSSGGQTVSVSRPGLGVLVINAGTPPIGPFLVSDQTYSEFSRILRTAPVSGNFMPFDIDPGFIREPSSNTEKPEPDDIFDPLNEGDWPSGLDDFACVAQGLC